MGEESKPQNPQIIVKQFFNGLVRKRTSKNYVMKGESVESRMSANHSPRSFCTAPNQIVYLPILPLSGQRLRRGPFLPSAHHQHTPAPVALPYLMLSIGQRNRESDIIKQFLNGLVRKRTSQTYVMKKRKGRRPNISKLFITQFLYGT